tara:strand:+ start:31 stop:342 length:312 start_codon:yes stop_codon:yes gene_type:complete
LTNNINSSLLFIFSIFVFGCFNANSGVIIEDDKSYMSFQCSSNDTYYISINDDISFVVDENSCDNLFQIPIGKNRVVVTKKGQEIIVRDIFSSNGTTINIDLP